MANGGAAAETRKHCLRAVVVPLLHFVRRLHSRARFIAGLPGDFALVLTRLTCVLIPMGGRTRLGPVHTGGPSTAIWLISFLRECGSCKEYPCYGQSNCCSHCGSLLEVSFPDETTARAACSFHKRKRPRFGGRKVTKMFAMKISTRKTCTINTPTLCLVPQVPAA